MGFSLLALFRFFAIAVFIFGLTGFLGNLLALDLHSLKKKCGSACAFDVFADWFVCAFWESVRLCILGVGSSVHSASRFVCAFWESVRLCILGVGSSVQFGPSVQSANLVWVWHCADRCLRAV